MSYSFVMSRDELMEMKRQIENEYKADIAAVTQLMKRFPEKPDKTPLLGEVFKNEKKVFALVSALVQTLEKKFSVQDVMDSLALTLGEQPNRQTVYTTIHRLKEDNKIKVIQKAQGRRPASYEKTSPVG